jgi:NAD(P)-dependent dehydrogenase (short-subunit alcohol dehydrogenase family)
MSTVSVVTGANSGIGRAISIGLARHGHQVYGTVRDPHRAGKLQSMAADDGVEVRLVTLDVGDDDSVRKGFAEILGREGHIDVLVNNAGVGGNAVVEETTPAQLLEVTNINVGGAVRCLQAVLPGMRERRHGSVVNISSVVGRFGAIGQAPYVASKWALEGLSEQLALELAPFGIRVIIIEPGVTRTPPERMTSTINGCLSSTPRVSRRPPIHLMWSTWCITPSAPIPRSFGTSVRGAAPRSWPDGSA